MNTPPKEENDAQVIDQLADPDDVLPELRVYSHNRLFYWWPVWITGYVMALITYISGTQIQTAQLHEYMHPSDNLGVIFIAVAFLVLIFTNFSFRGFASIGAGLVAASVAMLFALLGVWDSIFGALSYLSVHMNLGFYLLFSTLLFLLWAYATFVHIRFCYYKIRPGQIEEAKLVGDSEVSYDTRGAVVEKFGEDFFRHWILGLGSGDIRITTSGARSEEIIIYNVLHIDRTIANLRKLTSVQPDSLMDELEHKDASNAV